MRRAVYTLWALGVLLVLFGGCAKQKPSGKDELTLVATTTIAADVVSVVAGREIPALLPVGADPHSFEPTPADMRRVADADMVFINGLGLEHSLDNLLEAAEGSGKLVSLSQTLTPRTRELERHGHDHGHHKVDPHVWLDPNNIASWVEVIETTLTEADPSNAATCQENAADYRDSLTALDEWIRAKTAAIPLEHRRLVADHRLLGYFAERYGFEFVGSIFQGVSTLAEPSARELAALEDRIRDMDVPVIFVGMTVNPNLAQRIADDTGTRLVPLYTGSLSDSDGPAGTYLDFMRFNVRAMVEGLTGKNDL